jgi:hypothetical protein
MLLPASLIMCSPCLEVVRRRRRLMRMRTVVTTLGAQRLRRRRPLRRTLKYVYIYEYLPFEMEKANADVG